jgi:hypothetical protein
MTQVLTLAFQELLYPNNLDLSSWTQPSDGNLQGKVVFSGLHVMDRVLHLGFLLPRNRKLVMSELEFWRRLGAS